MQSLVRAFTHPAKSQPQRLPAFPNVEQSAVVALRAQGTVGVIVADTSTIGTRVVLARQPAFPLWADQSGAFGWGICSEVPLASANSGGTLADDVYTGDVVQDFAAVSNSVQVTLPSGTGIFRMLGTSPANYPVVGYDGGKAYTFCPPIAGTTATSISITVQCTNTNGLLLSTMDCNLLNYFRVYVERWMAPGRTTTDVLTLQGTFVQLTGKFNAVVLSAVVAAKPAGWYRVTGVSCRATISTTDGAPNFADILLGYAGTAPTFTMSGGLTAVTPSTSIALVPVAPPIEYTTTSAPYNGSRCTALALSVGNVTAIMNKEGVVTAGRLASSQDWGFTKATLSSLPPVKRFLGPLEAGFYVYSPPTSDLDLWLDYNYSFAQTNGPAWALASDAELIGLSLGDPSTATATLLSYQLDMHLEFQNYSQLWPAAMSRTSVEDLHRAVVEVLQRGFCFAGPQAPGTRAPRQSVLATAPAQRVPVVGDKKGNKEKKAVKTRFFGPPTKKQAERAQRRQAKRKQRRANRNKPN